MLKKIMSLVAHVRINMSLLISSVALCCSLINSAQAIPFERISQVYFFGDSLTDSGFNNLYYLSGDPLFPPTGKAPTFTTKNGYTWAQYIAHDIEGFTLPIAADYPGSGYIDTITNNTTPLIPGTWPVDPILQGVDYAAGGSTTDSTGNGLIWAPSLHAQVSHFLSTNPSLDPNALYFVWSGANDLLKVFASSATSPTFQLLLLEAANTAANNIAKEVALLSKHGAKRVVVLSLPNIGTTPLINDLVTDLLAPPTLPGDMKTASFTFNSMLNQQLGKVIAKHGTKILYVDVYTLLDNIILATKAGKPYKVRGESFLFTNYTSPVCGYVVPPSPYVVPEYVPAIDCDNESDGYIFADSVHPTGMAHRLLSLVVENEILRWR